MYWLRTRQHKHFVNQTHVSRLQDFEIIWTHVFLRTKSAFGVPNGFARLVPLAIFTQIVSTFVLSGLYHCMVQTDQVHELYP